MIRECRLGGDANEDDSSRFQPAQSSTLQPPSLLAGRSVLPADRALHRRLPLARCSGPGATTRNPSVHASECDHARVGLRLRTASAFGRLRSPFTLLLRCAAVSECSKFETFFIESRASMSGARRFMQGSLDNPSTQQISLFSHPDPVPSRLLTSCGAWRRQATIR
jgi:hypothetical protein